METISKNTAETHNNYNGLTNSQQLKNHQLNESGNGIDEWKLNEPEKIEYEKAAHTGKLVEFAKSRCQILIKLEDNIVTAQTDYIKREREFLSEVGLTINQSIEKNNELIKLEESEINKHKKIVNEIDIDKKTFQNNVDQAKSELAKINGEINNLTNEINAMNEKKKAIPNSIDPAILAKSKLTEEKNAMYYLFVWCMAVVYGETENKFYWDNFKKEAFINDKGTDFLNRLRCLKAKFTTEQRNMTERVLKAKPQIENFMQTSSKATAPAIAKLLEYIECLSAINAKYDSIKELDNKLETAQINLDIKQSECDVYNTQIIGYQARLTMLNKFESTLMGIIQNVNKIQPMAKERIESQVGVSEKINLKHQISFTEQPVQVQVQETINPVNDQPEIEVIEQHDEMKAEMRGQTESNSGPEMKFAAYPETTFTDQGNKAQSCQGCKECNIF